ncbi:MAG: dienelactone hydrolase family protein, partial [Verrucomicrobiota bacterium]
MKRLLFLLAACFAMATAHAQPWANQPWALSVLEKSPRHLEWITLKHGDREVKAYIGFPEVKTKATAIVLI